MALAHDSIFAKSLRSFCMTFGATIGALIGIVFVIMLFAFFATSNYLPPKSELTIMPDAKGDRSLLSGHAPAVLRLDIRGVIGMDGLTTEKIENLLLDSRDDLLGGERVKAILLYIDTPGGAATDSADIYHALMAYKEKHKVPIYAYVDGLCASGGMYIACSADKIYATNSSVIGSVGVIMGPTFNFFDAMTKLGISATTFTEGKDKDMLNPFRPAKPGEEACIQAILADDYGKFVSVVAAARPLLTKEKLVNEYGAHIFAADKAQELGYIDRSGATYTEALSALSAAAGIKEEYQVVRLSPPAPFLRGITQTALFSGKVTHTLDLGPYAQLEASGKPLYLYKP